MSAIATTEILPLSTDSDGTIRVGSTRVTLDTIVAVFDQGAGAEEIVYRFPSLDLADVYLVIGYILRHRVDVDAYLRQRQQQADEVRRQHNSRFEQRGIRERLLARLERQKAD